MDACRRTQVVLGCIVDDGDGLLLCRTAEGAWSIPLSTMADGDKSGKDALRCVLDTIGAEADLSFVYSIFDGALSDGAVTYIIYRGRLNSLRGTSRHACNSVRLFHPDEIPWDDIPDNAFRNMLGRYVAERGSERFGIYAESDGGGQVAVLENHPQPWASYATPDARNSRPVAIEK